MTNDKLRKILRFHDAAVAGINSNNCVCVHGVRGSGKTELLGEVTNSLLMSGVNVFFNTDAGRSSQKTTIAKASKDDNAALKELLRQLARMYGESTDSALLNFITAYTDGTLVGRDDTFRDIHRDAIAKFIYDCLKQEPTVFVVDDLDRCSDYTIILLDSLIKIGTLQFFVFSYTDNRENTALKDLLDGNKERITQLELTRDASTGSDNTSDTQDYEGIIIDEALLVLSRPGNEQQLIRHHVKHAERLIKELSYEKAAELLFTALDVCSSLDNTPEELSVKIDLLLRIGDVQALCKDYTEATESYLAAFQAVGLHEEQELSVLRLSSSVKLAQCYNKMHIADKAREHIMLCEAFFCVPEHRTGHYGLYTEHIVQYLYLLAELDERIIFREKLKQAYSVCKLDDKQFTCSLYLEEAFMCMEAGDFDKAQELLTEARDIATELGNNKLYCDASSSLAMCLEQIDEPDEGRHILDELIKKNTCPVKAAEAMVNIAIMLYKYDEDLESAVTYIQSAIDLCFLAGEPSVADDICENLSDTPLAVAFTGRERAVIPTRKSKVVISKKESPTSSVPEATAPKTSDAISPASETDYVRKTKSDQDAAPAAQDAKPTAAPVAQDAAPAVRKYDKNSIIDITLPEEDFLA